MLSTGVTFQRDGSAGNVHSFSVSSSSSVSFSSSSQPCALPQSAQRPDPGAGQAAGHSQVQVQRHHASVASDRRSLSDAVENDNGVMDAVNPLDAAPAPAAEDDRHQSVSRPVDHDLELPPYQEAAYTNFEWGTLSGEDFAHVIHSAYSEVVHWRRNVFLVPSGKTGKAFVVELSKLLNAFAQASALESVALEAVMVACILLLQKPHMASKARDHAAALERRLRAWNAGDVDGLLREGRAIQAHLPGPQSDQSAGKDGRVMQIFSRLVFAGKIHAALRYLSDNQGNGILSLDEVSGPDDQKVRDLLREKHPPPGEVYREAVLTAENEHFQHPPPVHDVLFESITGDTIRAAALRTQGSAGPSGVDSAGWRRMLTSFHRASSDLCVAVAAMARRLCTSYIDPSVMSAFVACRLVPLNKNPGVRPIGVCEVLRRIVGKAIMRTVGPDVLRAAGPLQLCAGQDAGCEAVIHAMQTVFHDAKTDAVILVDASNAFNNMNRRVALLNILVLCPIIATVLINCYRGCAALYVGGETLLSQEGTTQGDPLAMAMFALASVPLINKIATPDATQAWYADDASSGGGLLALRTWWDHLVTYGPMYGYFPNAVKTSLVVKEPVYSAAVGCFEGTGVIITSVGKRHLGAAIGTDDFVEDYVKGKVQSWVREVEQLAQFAQSHPHAAFAAFTHGLVGRWVYLCRVLPMPEHLLQPLEHAIQNLFLPALTGQPPCNEQVRQLLAQPTRLGGLGVIDPTTLPSQHRVSSEISRPFTEQILHQRGDPMCAQVQQQSVKKYWQKKRREHQQVKATELSDTLPSSLCSSVTVASERGASAWLTALPLECYGFALHKGAFRDALALRYGWPLKYTSEQCACGTAFSADHALTCQYGGYLSHRHNEIRNITAELMRETCRDVSIEPQLQPLTGERLPSSANRADEARLDIKASGFWDCDQQSAFFDVRVFHPLAQSYRNTRLPAVYRQHEMAKKRAYGDRVRQVEHGCFTPLVFSTSGGMGREATVVYKRLANLLSISRNEPYSVIMGWLRCRISFALLRSSLSCIRGTRSRLHDKNTPPCFGLVAAESRCR